MRKKAEEAEARSKPPPGELRIGQNKKFKREHRELEKSIGYPGGMPSIREESDNYMTRATGFFLEQG